MRVITQIGRILFDTVQTTGMTCTNPVSLCTVWNTKDQAVTQARNIVHPLIWIPENLQKLTHL
jgi:hypothetical protein